jgi:hypothetical protein
MLVPAVNGSIPAKPSLQALGGGVDVIDLEESQAICSVFSM